MNNKMSIRRIRHLNQKLLICSGASVVGYPMTFKRETACAIYCP